VYDVKDKIPFSMNKERLKLIVKNMELLVQSLKDELELEQPIEYAQETQVSYIEDYDEVYYDDDNE
jgi:hypothetical protein